MQKIKLAILAIFSLGLLVCPQIIFASENGRVNVADWYIKDFNSVITVNKDSTLDIVETITADCGNAQGKHGIFRVLPTEVKITDGTTIKTPIKLLSITNENGKDYGYQETKNSSDATITWKIGEADVLVTGVNVYKIHYTVKNVIRFGNAQFDELYWNLSGNFWDLEIDKFHAKIIFPESVTEKNSTVEYYVGALGSKDKTSASFFWSSSNVLEFNSNRTLLIREGVTTSVIFPKNIFTSYQFGFWETYGEYTSFVLPFLAFFICFFLWWKYGKDPRMDKTIIAEYETPGNMSPIELGMLMRNGKFDNKFITAELIYFATRGIITIKETSEKVLFFTSKDFELERKQNTEAEGKLSEAQKMILEDIFDGKQKIQLSDLKTSFYKNISDIEKATQKILESKELIAASGLRLGNTFRIISMVGFGLVIFSFSQSAFVAGLGILAAVAILLIFSFIMPKRTVTGAEMNWKAKGFKLFMETVDKDRAAFYEKENIFEKCLPYAIVFGITSLWIKRMEEIYGKDYYTTYAPLWYAGSIASFDAENFVGAMDSLSSEISANISAPSGSGGGGGAGGGGGGGGGGGW